VARSFEIAGAAAFVRLWFLLFFSYATIKFAINLMVLGAIDLRPIAFWELLLLPLGQGAVFWLITRRRRSGEGSR